jgi:hypothetical protein
MNTNIFQEKENKQQNNFQGYLEKCGGIFHIWKKIFVKLEDFKLKYFKQKNDTNTPCAVINFKEVSCEL